MKLQLLPVRADMKGATHTKCSPLSMSHKLCVGLVLNGVELILRSKQQGSEHPETSEGLAPTPPYPLPKKDDYSYISFPPTLSILSAISRGVVIATPAPPFRTSQSQELEDEAACSFCVLCFSRSAPVSFAHATAGSCSAGNNLMIVLTRSWLLTTNRH